ncbi:MULTISPECIES: hypothetical protein [unclassified Bradyrhizobium]
MSGNEMHIIQSGGLTASVQAPSCAIGLAAGSSKGHRITSDDQS